MRAAPRPPQVTHGDADVYGARRLWAAVLEQAIAELRGRSAATRYRNVAWREFELRQVRWWFESKSEEPTSFRWICHGLGLDPDQVLKRIREEVQR